MLRFFAHVGRVLFGLVLVSAILLVFQAGDMESAPFGGEKVASLALDAAMFSLVLASACHVVLMATATPDSRDDDESMPFGAAGLAAAGGAPRTAEDYAAMYPGLESAKYFAMRGSA